MSFIVEKKDRITIAVDGHSSCGKSTLARDLAKKLGYIYIDTGAMYRAITLKIMREGIDLNDHSAIEDLLKRTDIHFEKKEGKDHLILDGEDVESDIRTPAVASLVSPVAEKSSIRAFLVALQQEAGKNKGVVMEGRDIATVVFPDAEMKFFVTANLDTRAQRRHLELQSKGIEISLEEVKKNLAERDHIDSNRQDSPLRRDPEAVLIDTSHHSRKSQVNLAHQIVCQKIISLNG